ncbi:MAG: discoidin domain-containing protein [Cytophagaceae bacterium]
MKNFFTYLFVVIPLWVFSQTGTSTWVRTGPDGRLVYTPDARGNTIPDFSRVGYQYGDVAIPAVPVVRTLTAVVGDNLTQIQRAIDEVSALPLNSQGFRGTILLRAGEYRVSNTLNIRASGIVIRGEGNTTTGTRIVATRTAQHTVIQISGAGTPAETAGTRRRITNSYVPVGATSFNVENASGYAVGDRVILRVEPKQSWIDLLGMAQYGWTTSAYRISYLRIVTGVSGNTITLDAPVVDPIDVNLKEGFIYKYSWNRIENIGIENIRFSSVYSTADDENHAWTAIGFSNMQHGWVRNSNFYHFGYSAVHVRGSAANVSVINCHNYEPISQTTGGRKYSFNCDGQLNLFRDCSTDGGRHDYVTGAQTPGPNVFVKCRATNMRSDIGPHHRWATGLLFDNIVGNGEMNVQNRTNSGTGHGWAGAQTVFWNCTGSKFVVQRPAQHFNWAIGCKGNVTDQGTWVKGSPGIWESTGNHVTITSLYEKQLYDRLNPNRAPSVSITSPANNSTFVAGTNLTINTNATDPDGAVARVEFFAGSTKIGERTSTPWNFTWNNIPEGTVVLTARATDNSGAVTTSSAISITITPACQVVSASAHDGNVPENVLDNNFGTRWSANGDGQWIQFCLDAEKDITGVEIAFFNGDTRVSTIDILTSLNGSSWSTAAAGLKSSGTSLGFERFSFAVRKAKYVRIIGRGNSVNAWNSFTEVKINLAVPCIPASASADDGNVPANVLDNDLNTRWSANGVGQWLLLCLGTERNINAIQIAFYNGNLRVSNFDVLTSVDGITFTPVLTGMTSSGRSLDLESFAFRTVRAKFVRIVGNGNSSNSWNSFTEVKVNEAKANDHPYGGVSRAIPGRIEAEDFDEGALNVAYFDNTTGNNGAVYRTNTDVDIQACLDVDGGYNVGWIAAGEWLKYTVNVRTAGQYTLQARVSATSTGRTFHVEIDGVNVSGNITVPNTGNYQSYQTVTAANVYLTSGIKTMRIVMNSPSFNINYVEFSNTPVMITSNRRMADTEQELEIKNTPNPFYADTEVEVNFQESGFAKVVVVNKLGQELIIVNESMVAAGKQTFNINAADLSPDIYFCKIYQNGKVSCKKIIKQ